MDPEDQTYLRGYMQWRASHRGSKLKSDLVMRGDDLGATLGDSDHVADYPIISISRNEGWFSSASIPTSTLQEHESTNAIYDDGRN